MVRCVYRKSSSVSSEDVTRVNLLLHAVQTAVVAVGDDGLSLALELFQVVDNLKYFA